MRGVLAPERLALPRPLADKRRGQGVVVGGGKGTDGPGPRAARCPMGNCHARRLLVGSPPLRGGVHPLFLQEPGRQPLLQQRGW